MALPEHDSPAWDWSAFDVYLAVRAPPERVLERWRTAAGLESFFIRTAVFRSPSGEVRGPHEPALPGDRYLWTYWHGARSEGQVLAGRDGDEVSFTFGPTATVRLRCRATHGGCLIELRQENIADTEDARAHEHLNCRGGWIHFLTVLKGLVEHGVDIRDRDPATAGSLSTRFRPA